MSLIAGVSMPAMAVIFGNMTSTYQQQTQSGMMELAGDYSLYFIATGVIIFLATWIMYTLFTYTGERQAIQFRKNYLLSLMNQEIGWFDSIDQNQLNSKMNIEIKQIQESISEQLSYFIKNASTAGSGIIIALILGWQLALVILSSIPFLAITIVLVVRSSQQLENLHKKILLQVAGLVEQALVALKTVKVLNGCLFQKEQLQNIFTSNQHALRRFSFQFSMSFGVMYFIQLCIYALGSYYGCYLIESEVPINNTAYYDSTNTPTIFFCVVWGNLQLSELAPSFSCIMQGVRAGTNAFEVIDRIPKKLTNMEGRILQNFAGDIEFKNVEFQYERSDKVVLNGVNFKVKAGQKVAFVGRSGCGKSTIFSLIQKFYETYTGSILMGSEQIEIKELDPSDFYRQIVVVNQEPALFSGSIKDNLLFGNSTASDEEIKLALQQSNAMEFIKRLPLGWNTNVGTGGNQLSGGQKQRIAIARALLKKPKLILLVEATSALDRVNEKKIQQTLDLLSKNTTTLIIAHRLTTVQNADVIYMVEDGRIVEQGNHKELMAKCGKYSELVSIQIYENDDDILLDDEEIEQFQIYKDIQMEAYQLTDTVPEGNITNKAQDKVKLKYSQCSRLDIYFWNDMCSYHWMTISYFFNL